MTKETDTSSEPISAQDARTGVAKEEIGHRLKQARRAAGLSQQQAADKLGLHVNTYQKWETGERIASWPRIAAAAAVVGSSPNELLKFDPTANLSFIISEKLDPALIGHALAAVADIALEKSEQDPSVLANPAVMDEDHPFWTVMGRAFADIISMTLSGQSGYEASIYLRGVDRGYSQGVSNGANGPTPPEDYPTR